MKPFAPSKQKLFELLILAALGGVFYFFYPKIEGLTLFAGGFIWNWSAASDIAEYGYRFSMLNTVKRLQGLILKPFRETHPAVQRFVSMLPAGVFWSLVIYINESLMPWWATFIGSAMFELMHLELNHLGKEKT